jgi:two-component system sensor histidine kinase/response regulator
MIEEAEKQSRILIVDDNAKTIQVIAHLLKETKCYVTYAMDGQIALSVLRKTNDFDLALININLPDTDGYELCRQIRTDAALKETSVILLTTLTDSESIVKGFDAGAQDYVTKPFNARELVLRVKNQLELKRGRDQQKQLNNWLQLKVEEKTHELQKVYNELNRLDSMKTNIMVMISHEIRTPLNSIVGTLNLIKNQEQSAIIKNMIDTLEVSVARLEGFTTKAVLASRLNAGNYQLQLDNINIYELVQFAVIDQGFIIQNKKLEIVTSQTGTNFEINADRDLLFKSLIYILENALEHSPNESKVLIKLSRNKSELKISITDSGKGFTPEMLNAVFDPFTTDYNKISNTGLSIYLSRQIMELHNGKLKISNTPNSGACAELIFNC